MKKRNMNENKRPFLGAKRKWGTRPKNYGSPLGFLFLLFVLSLSFSYAQQTIDITATDAVNSNELVTKSQLDAIAASSTDDQTLTLMGNTLTLENGGTVDLTPYLDNTDGQTITDFSLSGNILSLTLSGGNTETVDLGSITGGGTDDQTISILNSTITLEDGGSIDLNAHNVDYDNTTSGLIANDMQAAIDEVAASGGSNNDFFTGTELTSGYQFTAADFTSGKKQFWYDGTTDIEVEVPSDVATNGQKLIVWQYNSGRVQVKLGSGVNGVEWQTSDNTNPVTLTKSFDTSFGYRPVGNYEDYTPSPTHPNASNPNPELVTGDAIAFESNANTVEAEPTGFRDPVGATVTSVADSSNNYVDYVARITADADGTLRRDRLDLDHISWENGEIYEVYILNRQNNTNDSFRYRISQGTTSGDHNTTLASHTDWQLTNFEFTSDGGMPRLEVFARNSSLTGEYSDVLISIKKKDD